MIFFWLLFIEQEVLAAMPNLAIRSAGRVKVLSEPRLSGMTEVPTSSCAFRGMLLQLKMLWFHHKLAKPG